MQVNAPWLKKIPSALARNMRCMMATLLLLIYVVGEFALTSSVLCAVAEASGEHQVLLREHSVVLHHPRGNDSPHHGVTHLLVSLSQRDASGDHVLSYLDSGLYEEPRDSLCVDDAAESCEDYFAFQQTKAASAYALLSSAIQPAHDTHEGQTCLARWVTVRLMI